MNFRRCFELSDMVEQNPYTASQRRRGAAGGSGAVLAGSLVYLVL